MQLLRLAKRSLKRTRFADQLSLVAGQMLLTLVPDPVRRSVGNPHADGGKTSLENVNGCAGSGGRRRHFLGHARNRRPARSPRTYSAPLAPPNVIRVTYGPPPGPP